MKLRTLSFVLCCLAAPVLQAQDTVLRYSFTVGQDLTTVFDEGPAGNNALGQPGAAVSGEIPSEGVPDDSGEASLDSIGLGGLVTENTLLLSNDQIVAAGGFVMECWFWWNGAGTVNSIIDYAGTEKIVLDGTSGELAMLIAGTGRVPIGTVQPGEWHYVAVVFDTLGDPATVEGFATGTLTCYLDSLAPAVVREGAIKDNFGDSLIRSIGIGQHPNGFAADFFDGLTYEPRVTLGVLDPEDLLLDARVIDPPSTLLAYRFSTAMPLPAIADTSDAGNDATAAAGASLSEDTPPADVPGGGDASLSTAAGGATTDAAGLLTTTAVSDTSGFTMEGWFRWDGAAGGALIDGSNGNRVAVDGTGQVELILAGASNVLIGQAVADEWHWFGVVFDSDSTLPDGGGALTGDVTTYFDGLGTPETTEGVVLAMTDGGAGIGIGQSPDGSNTFGGNIYAPTVSLGPLAPSALSFVLPLPDPVTVFRYSEFDADLFPDVFDFSDSANDATAGLLAGVVEDVPEDGVPDDAEGEFSLDSRGGTQAEPTGIVTNEVSLLTNDQIAAFGGFTMECWFQWAGGGGVNSIIDYAGTEKIVIDERNGDNFGLVKMRISGTGDLDISTATPGEWHYVAVVFATGGQAQAGDGTIGGTVTVYFDGTEAVASYEGATKDNFGDSLIRPIGVGQHPLGFDLDFFEGFVFEPRVTLGPLNPEDLLYGGGGNQEGFLFLRGDCNSDGGTGSVTDAVFLLNYNFTGGDVPSCFAACDVNGDGSIASVTDAVNLLSHNFLGGPPPAAPYPECGFSNTPGDIALGCVAAPGCAN